MRNNYYPGYNSYPQYRGLNSGITFSDNNSVSQGWQSMVDSLSAIAESKLNDEKQKQEQFQKLIDVSLKGINGRYRDEAVNLRDAFIKKSTDLARQNQGQFTWEQTKQLENERDKLDNYSGMYNDVQDWYKNAMLKAMQIKDVDARNATVKNIADIMENSPDLKTTWDRTNSPDWLVAPKPKYDLKKDIIEKIPGTLTSAGTKNINGYKKGIRALLESGDKAMTWYKEQWDEKHPGENPQRFIDDLADVRAQYVTPKYHDPSIVPSPSNGGRNAKGKYYTYKGRLYQKGDARPVIKPNSNGNYNIGDAPVKLTSWTDAKGKTYKNASVVGIKKVDGKYMAVIQHDKYTEDNTKKEFIEKNGQDAWDAAVMAGEVKEPKPHKDQVQAAKELVPLDEVYNVIDRHVILKDVNAGGVDMEAIDSLLGKKSTGKNSKNPLGLNLSKKSRYKKEVSK